MLIAFFRQLISLIVYIQIVFRFGGFLSAPPSSFPAKAAKSSGFLSVACCPDVFASHQEKKHIEHITERCLIAKKKYSFKERAERNLKYWCKRCRRVNRQFSAPSVRVFVLDLC